MVRERFFLGASAVLSRVSSVQTELNLRSLYEGASTWVEILDHLAEHDLLPAAFYPVYRLPDITLSECDCILTRKGNVVD